MDLPSGRTETMGVLRCSFRQEAWYGNISCILRIIMSLCLRRTVLFFSSLVGHIAGYLNQPQNVKIESRNYSLFLTWLPASGYSSETYEVQYRDHSDSRWRTVPACEYISITECEFTCAVMKLKYLNQTIRLRIVSPSISSWVEIPNVEYIDAVDPEPPNIAITQENGTMKIEAFIQTPMCVPEILFKSVLKYLIVIKGNNPNKVLYEQELDEPSMTIKTLGYKGEYCVAARTKFLNKESEFSHPVCINFTQNDEYSHRVLFAAVPVSLIVGTIVLIILLILYITRLKSKKPKVLDFSNNNYCQKNYCLPELYSEKYDTFTIYNIAEQDSTGKFLLPSKYDGSNSYQISVRGYMVRPAMQASGSHSQESYSSNGLTFSYSSDQSSSGCACPNISGSDSDMLLKSINDHTNDCPQESNINVLGDLQMCSSTAISESHLFNSISILGSNLSVNIPIDTLCIVDNNTHMDNADGESNNQCFTDSEDSLDLLSTDYKMSDHNYPLQEEETCKDWNSGYTQRTFK